MKKYSLPLTLLFLGCTILAGQEKPVPPGRRELRDYQTKNVDVPVQVSVPRPDPAKLEKEAAELSDLAQSIPSDIDSVSKGVLPKDVIAKLKRIEKISKHLRAEVTP